jgi:hypothetical protein
MQILGIKNLGKNHSHKWPGGEEKYKFFIEYNARAEDGDHSALVAFGNGQRYDQDRVIVVVFIDGIVHAEFLAADDFEKSGEVLSEIRIPGDRAQRMCDYRSEPVPERYTMFNVVGLPLRVACKGVHNAWAVVANIADHKTLISLGGLRRMERAR